jgi:hypothetical protein
MDGAVARGEQWKRDDDGEHGDEAHDEQGGVERGDGAPRSALALQYRLSHG